MREYNLHWKDFLNPIKGTSRYIERTEKFIQKHSKLESYIKTNSQILAVYRGAFLGLTAISTLFGLEAMLK